ncbi:MAG TPA: AsmA family protein [Verrucomicrobiae bacterium]|nr:AsmA family protein [Verrucomicrobiae bacterium]
MKAARIILIVVAGLVVVVTLLVAAGLYMANRHVQSPAFKQEILTVARQELGADVHIEALHASLFSGMTLDGVTINNPTNFPGSLLTADSFVLRYRLWPLIEKRVEIEQLSLDKPVITLVRDNAGEWNYEQLGAKPSESKPPSATKPSISPPPAKSETAIPFNLVLSKLAIAHGSVSITGEKDKPLLRLDGINLSSSLNVADGNLGGSGKSSIDRVNVAEKLFVQQLAAPVSISSEHVKLAPLSGKIADGAIMGEATMELKPTFGYAADVQIKESDVAKLLGEAGAKQVLIGKLELTTKLNGTGGLATMAGTGRAEVRNGHLASIPLMNLLATLLQVPDLRELPFTECLLEFSITNNTMVTPVIRIVSPEVQITGKGVVSLEDYSLNHNLTIAFARGMLDRAPTEVRNLFTEQTNGWLALEFRVWGPYDSPQTDLQTRIAKGVGQQLLQKGLQKLFK